MAEKRDAKNSKENRTAPIRAGKSKRRFFALSAMMAALLAVFSPWTVPLGALPVTLATFVLFLMAALMPRRVSVTATAVYLAMGALGLPIFASFSGGFGVLVGATGGFLWGYIPAVFFVSLAPTSKKHRCWALPLTMLGATVLLYLFGMGWFAAVSHATLHEAFLTAVLPFLLPDLVKIVAATAVALAVDRRVKLFLGRI